MMHVDDALRIARDEIGREHLHITRQNDQLYSMPLQERKLGALRPGFTPFHGRVAKRDLVKIRQVTGLCVITDNGGDTASQLSDAITVEKVQQAVLVPGDKDRHEGGLV